VLSRQGYPLCFLHSSIVLRRYEVRSRNVGMASKILRVTRVELQSQPTRVNRFLWASKGREAFSQPTQGSREIGVDFQAAFAFPDGVPQAYQLASMPRP
jgi:hypothetical protein